MPRKKDIVDSIQDFPDLKLALEKLIPHAFELLEMHYAPYSFGSGYCAYRIRERNILFIFSGKDGMAELHASAVHENYPSKTWTKLYEGPIDDFLVSASHILQTI